MSLTHPAAKSFAPSLCMGSCWRLTLGGKTILTEVNNIASRRGSAFRVRPAEASPGPEAAFPPGASCTAIPAEQRGPPQACNPQGAGRPGLGCSPLCRPSAPRPEGRLRLQPGAQPARSPRGDRGSPPPTAGPAPTDPASRAAAEERSPYLLDIHGSAPPLGGRLHLRPRGRERRGRPPPTRLHSLPLAPWRPNKMAAAAEAGPARRAEPRGGLHRARGDKEGESGPAPRRRPARPSPRGPLGRVSGDNRLVRFAEGRSGLGLGEVLLERRARATSVRAHDGLAHEGRGLFGAKAVRDSKGANRRARRGSRGRPVV